MNNPYKPTWRDYAGLSLLALPIGVVFGVAAFVIGWKESLFGVFLFLFSIGCVYSGLRIIGRDHR